MVVSNLPLRTYGRRTSSVRLLWVVASSPPLHTGRMASDAARTALITGADRFISRALGPHVCAVR